MKIKKIILTALCLIMAVFALVSCEEDILEEAKEPLDEINSIYKPVVLEKANLDLYIITDEATTDNAITTVSKSIQEFLDDRNNKKFDITLNIHYIRGDIDNYKAEIANINSGIVLIAGADMLDEMVKADRLADLNGYFTDSALKQKYQYATLNLEITKNLLDASLSEVVETVTNGDGTTETVTKDARFFIPNDHVIGTYDYLLINKDMAKYLGFSLTEIASMTSIEDDATQALKSKFEEFKSNFDGKTVDDLVKVVKGVSYEARFEYQAQGYVCNITKKPTVTLDEAAQSGFGILSGTENITAAMEVIYLLNTNATLRNLLQYGNVSVNYLMNDGVVTPYVSGENVYKMDLRYTGNMFLGYYCETEGWVLWNEDIVNNGRAQNSESQLAQ